MTDKSEPHGLLRIGRLVLRVVRFVAIALVLAVVAVACIWGYKYHQRVHNEPFEHETASAKNGRRVLLLGNSVTYYNDMPRMLRALSDAEQVTPLHVEWVTAPGAFIADFDDSEVIQERLNEDWDTVIAQPLTWEARIMNYDQKGRTSYVLTCHLRFTRWCSADRSLAGLRHVREKTKSSRFGFFVPAPTTPDAMASYKKARGFYRDAEFSVSFWSRYVDVAELLPLATSYALCAATAELESLRPGTEKGDAFADKLPMMRAPDLAHPGPGGSYLIAWRLLQFIEQRELEPVGPWWHPETLSEQEALAVRQCANRAARD